MSASAVEVEKPLAEALKTPEIRPIVISTIGEPDELKTALLYLEANDWCATSAIVHIGLDQANAVAFTSGKLVDRNDENPKIDRSLAKAGPDFNNSYLTLNLSIDGKSRTLDYPHFDAFDPTCDDDIIALNIWRHAKIREHVGLPNTSVPSGEHWHPLQEAFLFHRYAAQNVDKRGVQYDKITDELNKMFAGVILPGRYKPCEPRTQNATVSLLTRKVINPRTKGRRWPEKMSTIDKHHAAQKRVKDEKRELLDKNSERDQERFGGDEEEIADSTEEV